MRKTKTLPGGNGSVPLGVLEGLAKQHEVSVPVKVPGRSVPVHGFDKKGLQAFADALIEAERKRCSDLVDDKVEWGPCDCGCPNGQSPKSAADVDLLRLAAAIRMGRVAGPSKVG